MSSYEGVHRYLILEAAVLVPGMFVHLVQTFFQITAPGLLICQQLVYFISFQSLSLVLRLQVCHLPAQVHQQAVRALILKSVVKEHKKKSIFHAYTAAQAT